MGKNKKTRWRTLSFDGSKDETQQINEAEPQVSGNSVDSQSSSSNQKYSQILGDHHTNYYTTQLSNKSTSSSSQPHQNNFKARSFNKENYYNQRGALRSGASGAGLKNGWRSSNGSSTNYRPTAFNLKDNKKVVDESVKSGSNNAGGDDGKEPIKFNEDEYTRITTPRQDVLFKKGYLSRMNSTKTANSTTAPMASTSSTVHGDSTAPSSTATNSDPDSSVSTLSPATTPSMDYAHQDSMEYAPVYYPGYYDENGMLVIPAMYNGYNYYSPNGSATNSPVILLPYPYPYDPFFMAPNTEVPLSTTETDQTTNDGDDEEGGVENEKAENDDGGAKEDKQNAGEEINNESKDEKHEQKQSENSETATEGNEIDGGDQSIKSNFPIYGNEVGYVYPAAYANGYYNGFYYYNGMPSNRPPKFKRRKRFMNSRNSHSTSHPPRSAETTTDYSDDENSTQHNKRYHYPASRGHHQQHHWNYPQNGYNQYHYYNSKYNNNYNKYHHQNANQLPSDPQQLQHQSESNLNVDVQEFYPSRVQPMMNNSENAANHKAKELQKQESKCDESVNAAPVSVDLEQPQMKAARGKASQQQQPQQQIVKSLPPPLPVRATKKEIMEGIKSMEQQNINLNQKSVGIVPAATDVEWNVIKKGKKVKVVKDEEDQKAKVEIVEVSSVKSMSPSKSVETAPTKTQESTVSIQKKPSTAGTATQVTSVKSKKSKNKGKKKKSQHMMTKQHDGFEIIEPQFEKSLKSEEANVASEDEEEEEEETIIEDDPTTELIPECEEIVKKLELLIVKDDDDDDNNLGKEEAQLKQQVVVDKVGKMLEEVEEVILKKFIDTADAVIDISDEEICHSKLIELDLAEIAQELIKNGEDSLKSCEVLEVRTEATNDNDLMEHPVEQIAVIEEPIKKSKEVSLKLQINLPQVKKEEPEEEISDMLTPTFDDIHFFADHKNIAELERDLIENLRSIDDGIDIKSPLINPLYDFPITTAVSKWLQEKQNESFDSLFHVQNLKKLSELFDEYDDESDISESPIKSETTDSDYGSDCQVKISNGSAASSKSSSATSAKIEKKHAVKGASNKLRIVKESFCALM